MIPTDGTGAGASYPLATLRRDLRDDIDTYLDFAGEYRAGNKTFRRRLSALLTPSVTACALYRVSHWLHAKGWSRAALVVAWCNLWITRVSICPASRIGGGLYIPHPATSIVFQGTAGCNLRLFAGAGVSAMALSPLHRHALRNAPVLGDDVVLGYKALVVGPVTIGRGCAIGVNAVVSRDVPPDTTVLAMRRRRAPRA